MAQELAVICAAIRDRVSGRIPQSTLQVLYPAPRLLTATVPTLLLSAGQGDLAESNDEQMWTDRVRGLVLCGTTDLPSSINAADPLIEPIADCFSSRDLAGYKLGGLVDRCRVEDYEFGQIIEIAGGKYYGGEIWFGVKRHRFAVTG